VTDTTPIIIAIIAAVPGIISLYLALKKNELSRTEFVQDAAIDLLEPLKARIDAQERTIYEQARVMRQMEAQLSTIIRENESLRLRVRNLERENETLLGRLNGTACD